MTFREAEQNFKDSLRPIYESDEANSLTWLSIRHILKIEKIEYLNLKDTEFPPEQYESLLIILEELKCGKPLQYILGETEFYGLTFLVNSSVLIPRPETEELVEWLLTDISHSELSIDGLKIIDIGTGSGCIPITLKKHFPKASIYALDVSDEALNVSNQNAILNQTELNFIHADILNPSNNVIKDEKFSIIVSNPPYITVSEKHHMLPNVLEFEPHLALFVPNNDPLIFYKAIADFALKHLEKHGYLYLEINENLGWKAVQLLKEWGFSGIELRKDLSGKDRMIRSQKI